MDKFGYGGEVWEETKICDGCGSDFKKGDKIILYFCDSIWVEGEMRALPSPIPQELYCRICAGNKIPFPHEGTNEGYSLINVLENESGDFYEEEIQIVSGSPRQSGFDWDPAKIATEYLTMMPSVADYHITPMNVYITGVRTGLDLQSFVTNGEFNLPEHHKDQLQEIVSQNRSRNLSHATPGDL